MILENAFGYLPEILTGSNYAAQDYEAGIVTAVALAVLQELNARNVPNPLSNICVEKLYSVDGFSRGSDTTRQRYLRADMHVDLSPIWAGSKGLARFGWRYKNWVEAKFFRKGKIPSTTACAHIAADLIRLCALTPPECRESRRTFTGPHKIADSLDFSCLCTGRYFLHVYDSSPEDLVGKTGRPWVKQLRTPGNQKISFSVAADRASQEFVSKIGDAIKSIQIQLEVTNFCHEQHPSSRGYLCVLTRIDEFTVQMDSDAGSSLSYHEAQDRTGQQSEPSAFMRIRDNVGAYILLGDKKSRDKDDEPPTEDERDPEILAVGQNETEDDRT